MVGKMMVKDAERAGINTFMLWKAKKQIKERKPIDLSTKIIQRIIE